MPLCVSWESLLKGGLLPFLKETALLNPSLREESPSSQRALPTRKAPSWSSIPLNHLSSSPGATGLMPHPGMPPRREQGARMPWLSMEADDQGGQLAPTAAVGFVQ